MKFIGREAELARLDRMLGTEDMETVLIYGRRRVGKSALIKEFLRRSEVRALYYECKRTTEQNNVQSIAALIGERLRLPPLAFASMEAVLEFLFQQAEQERMVLVLDEYPYLRECCQGLDSILQSLIDRYTESSGLKLILCGSFIDVMKELLLAHNPLYGRINLTLHIRPMDYYDAARFYSGFSVADRVRLYSVFGGIPYYNRLIDERLSVRENIIKLVASPDARLENEVALYLHGELARLNNANEVFETLSRGFSRFSDILSQSHLASSAALSDTLKKLMLLEVVERVAPINDAGNRKKVGYHIADNLSRFYYRYIFRYASQLRIMDEDSFYDRYIRDDFERSYVPQVFENVCREYLIRENIAGRLAYSFSAIGKYYYDLPKEHRNGEFDVVTLDERGYVFYEAKFREKPITREMVEQEIAEVKAAGLACYEYGFFSRSGFAPDALAREEVRGMDLKDMYIY